MRSDVKPRDILRKGLTRTGFRLLVPGALMVRICVGVAVACLGIGLSVTLPLMVSWWMAAHPPVNLPPPNCPPGSYLYARSLIGGKWETPVYHCFRDADEREYTWVEPRPT